MGFSFVHLLILLVPIILIVGLIVVFSQRGR